MKKHFSLLLGAALLVLAPGTSSAVHWGEIDGAHLTQDERFAVTQKQDATANPPLMRARYYDIKKKPNAPIFGIVRSGGATQAEAASRTFQTMESDGNLRTVTGADYREAFKGRNGDIDPENPEMQIRYVQQDQQPLVIKDIFFSQDNERTHVPLISFLAENAPQRAIFVDYASIAQNTLQRIESGDTNRPCASDAEVRELFEFVGFTTLPNDRTALTKEEYWFSVTQPS